MKWQRHYQHGSGSLETSSYAEEERMSLVVSPSEQDKQERDKGPQGEAQDRASGCDLWHRRGGMGASKELWGVAGSGNTILAGSQIT